ncbi:MAG: hypothetical protein AAF571_12150 [Verrucomicrobiota bacterium]
MSTAEILAELPKLPEAEREEVFASLLQLKAAEQPTAREKTILNEAQAGYEADKDAGDDWSVVQKRLRDR